MAFQNYLKLFETKVEKFTNLFQYKKSFEKNKLKKRKSDKTKK